VPESSQLPSEGVRAAISFGLLLHFFALFVAVCSNVTPSALESRLRTVPGVRPYLQLLALDVPYQFQLTYAEEADFDHFLAATLELPDGQTHSVRIPEAHTWPGLRYRRLERLAGKVARSAEDWDLGNLLPQSVAESLLTQWSARSGQLRCPRPDIARLQREGAFVAPDLEAASDPREIYYRGGYDARIVRVGGLVQLFKAEPLAESAPTAVTSAPSSERPAQPPLGDEANRSADVENDENQAPQRPPRAKAAGDVP